jgi:fibronectin type 3 domain-containing protein
VVTTLSFDFGTDTSPTAPGFTQITPATVYNTTRRFGWLSGAIQSSDYPAIADPLTRDFNFTSNGTFATDLANGTYTVTVTMGWKAPRSIP